MNAIVTAVDKHRKLILDAERYIWQNPETGYKEFKTTKYMEDAFEALGYDVVRAEGITGFYTVLDTVSWMPCFALHIRRPIPQRVPCMPVGITPSVQRFWVLRRR